MTLLHVHLSDANLNDFCATLHACTKARAIYVPTRWKREKKGNDVVLANHFGDG